MKCRAAASWRWRRWTRKPITSAARPAGPLILEYGDYQCPYSRQAFHAIEHVERQLGGNVRFAFRHFPLTDIHPHALAAAAEAAARQGRFWDMHELLFHRQKRSKTATCAGTPPSSAWTWRPSTATGPAPR
jgi:Thioredoxin